MSRFDSASEPAGAFWFAARSAAASCDMVTPRAASAAGSMRTWSTFSRPPSTFTSATPCTRSICGFTRSIVKSCSVRMSNVAPPGPRASPAESTIQAM